MRITPERLRFDRQPLHPPIVDLRSPAAYLRGHLPGSVSIPSSKLLRSLFLLPPRDQGLILVAAKEADACEGAEALRERGWSRVQWLDGPLRDLGSGNLVSGREPNRIWEPAPLLRRFEPRLPRVGLACDLACGSGRDAAFLALGGRDVLGLDLLPDALQQARTVAREARIPTPGRVRFRRTDLSDPAVVRAVLRPGRFSVLTCFRYLDRGLFPSIAAAVASGGWLVAQTFLEEQARSGRKPKNPAYLLRPGELRGAFPGWRIVSYHEGQDREGNWMAGLVATKVAATDGAIRPPSGLRRDRPRR